MEDAVRFSSRFLLAVALVLSLFAPLGNRQHTHRLAISRDGDPTNPVKVIRRIVVWIFDELGVPQP
jgi:hypothetical protein